jgi:signal transduction histidine kinase
MMSDSSELQALRRVKTKNYFVCAALFMVASVPYCVVSGRVVWELVLLQCGWSASFLVLGTGMSRGWFSPRLSGVLAGLLSLVASVGFIHFTGGPDSPYFPLLAAVPLLIALFTPDTRVPTVLASAATVGAVAVLDGLAGTPWGHQVLQVAGFGMVGVLAFFAAQTYRRVRDTEAAAQRQVLEVQRERLVVLEKLAESERRRVRAERERAEVERLVLVGQLAAGVAHEVNNPLAFIQANLRYLLEELPREGRSVEDCVEALRETQAGVVRIQQIVQDLTRLARGSSEVERREVGSCPLPSIIEESMRLASVRLKKLAVEVEVPSEVPLVRADARRLGQVLLNLLLNAADALEEASVAGPRVALKVQAQPQRVWLVLEDNGPGFSPEHLPRLFTPFFTTKAQGKGTGLGLALSREYVEAFGGSLRAENRPEGGARFTVELLPA